MRSGDQGKSLGVYQSRNGTERHEGKSQKDVMFSEYIYIYILGDSNSSSSSRSGSGSGSRSSRRRSSTSSSGSSSFLALQWTARTLFPCVSSEFCLFLPGLRRCARSKPNFASIARQPWRQRGGRRPQVQREAPSDAPCCFLTSPPNTMVARHVSVGKSFWRAFIWPQRIVLCHYGR